jgi:NAD+ kinase
MTASATADMRIGPITTVGIVAKTQSPNATEAVRDAVAWLAGKGVATVLEADTARQATLDAPRTCTKDELPTAADLVLVIGGDGTLLGVANRIASADTNTPILAVNCGSLGFLTEVTLPEMFTALASVIAGDARIDERRMLRVRVVRGSETLANRLVLNDVVIAKSARSNIIEIAIAVGDQFVTASRADGLIVATPTGSTAYSLAAGGPIVHPTIEALLLTPIAPHTLTNRPIVIGDTAPVTVTPHLGGSHLDACASFDGQFNVELADGDAVVIERAPQPLRVVRAESRNYFAVLREKLKWGER